MLKTNKLRLNHAVQKKTRKTPYNKRVLKVFGQEPKNKLRKRRFMFLKVNRHFRHFYFSIYRTKRASYYNRLSFLYKKIQLLSNFYKLLYQINRQKKLKQFILLRKKNTVSKKFQFLKSVEMTLESRIIRSGLITNRLVVRWLIRNGLLFVNKKKITNPYTFVKNGSVVRFDSIFWYNLSKKIKFKKNVRPGYEINFKTGSFIPFCFNGLALVRKTRFFKSKILKPFINSYN